MIKAPQSAQKISDKSSKDKDLILSGYKSMNNTKTGGFGTNKVLVTEVDQFHPKSAIKGRSPQEAT